MGWVAAAGVAADIGLSFLGSGVSGHRARKFYRHRYQWQLNDMRKAGLNPLLMTSGGGGSAPNVGQQAQAYKPDIQKGVSNAIAQARQKQELATIRSQEQLNVFLGNKAVQDTATSAASAGQLGAMARESNARALTVELGFPAAQNAAQLHLDHRWTAKAQFFMQLMGPLIQGGMGYAAARAIFNRMGGNRMRGVNRNNMVNPARGAGRVPNARPITAKSTPQHRSTQWEDF